MYYNDYYTMQKRLWEKPNVNNIVNSKRQLFIKTFCYAHSLKNFPLFKQIMYVFFRAEVQ